MAAGENKWLKLTEDDVVILSAHAIPGNEYSVNKVIDGLWRLGAELVEPAAEFTRPASARAEVGRDHRS